MVFGGFQRLFRGFSEVFRGPLRDPLRGRFPSRRLSVLLPLFVLPLELSPRDIKTFDHDKGYETADVLKGPKPPK